MRFAGLQKNSPEYVAVKQGCAHPLGLIRFAYNLVFWVFLLPFVTSIDDSTGFIAFAIVIAIRLCLNLYVNNIVQSNLEQYDRFPFHI